jgi:hypothetical protein
MKCEGSCKDYDPPGCTGEVKTVVVYGPFCPNGLTFIYCQTAREEDERRGFTVEDVDEHGLTKSEYYNDITYPNG